MDPWLRIARSRKAQNDWEVALAVLNEAREANLQEARFLTAEIPLLMRLDERDRAMALRREASRSGARHPIRVLGTDGSLRTIVPRVRPSQPHRLPPRAPDAPR